MPCSLEKWAWPRKTQAFLLKYRLCQGRTASWGWGTRGVRAGRLPGEEAAERPSPEWPSTFHRHSETSAIQPSSPPYVPDPWIQVHSILLAIFLPGTSSTWLTSLIFSDCIHRAATEHPAHPRPLYGYSSACCSHPPGCPSTSPSPITHSSKGINKFPQGPAF
jgi:hypothetical protein